MVEWGCGGGGDGEGRGGQTGEREGTGYSPCGLGLRLPPRRSFHGRVPPLTPHPDKPNPLPFRKDCHHQRRKVGELWESPLSLQLKVQASVGGEVVAGWG